jgi:3-oxoacyl-[acyl-carrier protein] reductase
MIDRIAARYSRLDICVNNAGMATLGTLDASAPIHALRQEDWDTGLRRNLTTAFLVTRAVLPLMRSRRYGRIVNVASTTGPVAAVPGDAAYAAAKAGMVGLRRDRARWRSCRQALRHRWGGPEDRPRWPRRSRSWRRPGLRT